MKSYITASIVFYFKGEKFSFSDDIHVESWLKNNQDDMEALYDHLAKKHGLDRYRHEYDIMIMEPIHFSQATGLADHFTHDGHFDIEGFRVARLEQSISKRLESIAKKHLQVKNLDEHPKLKAALWDAYHAHKQQQSTSAVHESTFMTL